MELCALAAEEQDSDKLLELTQEINKLLAEKEQRSKESSTRLFPPTSPSPASQRPSPAPD